MKKKLTQKEASKVVGASGWSIGPVIGPGYAGIQVEKTSS